MGILTDLITKPVPRSLFVITMVIVVSAMAVRAFDTAQTPELCGSGMSPVSSLTFSCVDTYEVSAGNNCPSLDPKNGTDTGRNLLVQKCLGVSAENAIPWRFITREEARAVCARSGKRLPSAEEWYEAALGTVTQSCQLRGGVVQTGSRSDCRSAVGAHDMAGNVWEWVTDDVVDGTYEGRNLPGSGYVAAVDQVGLPTATEVSTTTPLYGDDYFWLERAGVQAILRGGFYGSGEDGGVFASQANVAPTLASAGVGFRCIK